MRAIRIQGYGGPEAMQLQELPTPVPAAGQALVRVAAASVNFLDVQKRRGELVGQAFYKKAAVGETDLPTTMGSQGAGVLEAVGDGVANFKPGDQVVFAGASYATHAVVPAPRLIRLPDELPLDQAAAGMNQGFRPTPSFTSHIPSSRAIGALSKQPPEVSARSCAKWRSCGEAG
jgi:NADPH:quinone reductase